MKPSALILLLGCLLLGADLPCGNPGFHVVGKDLMVWTAPSRGWEVGGCKTWDGFDFAGALRSKPPGSEIMKFYERVVEDPGEWLNFVIRFCSVKKVTFTKNTKIVLIDKNNRRIVSETICFWKDFAQTELYDANVGPVVVTSKSVRCVKGSDRPLGAVKFRAGSFKYRDIVAFEVIGAAEGSGNDDAR